MDSFYGFDHTSATVANGAHALSAKAYDAAGNSTTSASSIVSVRNHKK